MFSLRRISISSKRQRLSFTGLFCSSCAHFYFIGWDVGYIFEGFFFSPKATKELHTKKSVLIWEAQQGKDSTSKSAWWTPAEDFCQTIINLLDPSVCQWPKIPHRNGLTGPLLTQQKYNAKSARNLGFVVWWLKSDFLSYSLSSSSWVWSVR